MPGGTEEYYDNPHQDRRPKLFTSIIFKWYKGVGSEYGAEEEEKNKVILED